jgi:hypothetical protein
MIAKSSSVFVTGGRLYILQDNLEGILFSPFALRRFVRHRHKKTSENRHKILSLASMYKYNYLLM